MESLERLTAVINWRQLLVEHYKSLFLSEQEVMIILMISLLLEHGMTVVTPEDLAHKMTLPLKEIDQLYSALSAKGYILLTEQSSGNYRTTLNGIQTLVVSHFLVMNSRQDTKQKTVQQKQEEESLYSLFEKEFGHTLSSIEIDIIRSWLDLGYPIQRIKAALQEALMAKVRNIHYVDRILLQWSQQEERQKEGYTPQTEEWRKDLQKSIEIAKYDWTKNGQNK